MDKEQRYDEVVSLFIQNIIAERNRCGGHYLWSFNPDDDAHRLYFNATAIVADFQKEPIYIDMDFLPYLKLRWKMRKRRNLRYLRWQAAYRSQLEQSTSINIIINYICDYLKIDRSFLKEINDAYYGWE